MASPSSASTADITAQHQQLRVAVDSALSEFVARQHERATHISPELTPLLAALAEFVRGGKRLRPLFGYWGLRATGVSPELIPSDPHIQALAALEWLHACALIHDDIMDASDTRRGKPAMHRLFATRHFENNWRGKSDQYGLSTAILLGDLCLVWSDEAWHTSQLPAATLHAARPYVDQMRTELMFGQYLDVVADSIGDGSAHRATMVLQYKSAKYTVEYPLLIGAALAGATPATQQTLRGYGLPLGEAFQLRDDVLGVFGDPSVTGKPAGDDLREGKRTLLTAETLSRSDTATAAKVLNGLGNPDLTNAQVGQLRTIIIDSGALAAIEQRITELTSAAMAALTSGTLDPSATAALADLSAIVTNRSH